MGSDRTSQMPYDTIPGVLIPWEWQDRTATSGDVDHAEPSPGADVYDGTSRARLQLTGTPSYVDGNGATQVPYTIQATTVGGQANGAAGWVWRRDGTSHWYGQDRPVIVTGYQRVSNSGGNVCSCPSAITLQDGSLLTAWGQDDGTSSMVYVRRRTGQTWSASIVSMDTYSLSVTDDPAAGQPVALAELASGDVVMVTISSWSTSRWSMVVYRSDDSGATWAEQSIDTAVWTADPPRVMRLAAMPDGRLVLAATRKTGSSSEVTTYVSADEGVSWSTIETATLSASGVCVWDLQIVRGGLVAVVEWGDGWTGVSTGIGWIEVDDPASAWVGAISTTTVQDLTQYSGDRRWLTGGWIAADPYDDSGYLFGTHVGYGAGLYGDVKIRRTSLGTTQNLAGCGSSSSAALAQVQAVWWRGSLTMIGCTYQDGVGVLNGQVWDVRVGGQTDMCLTRDYSRDNGSFTSLDWIALDTVSGNWTAQDDTSGGGTVTRTHATLTGQRLVTTNALGRYSASVVSTPSSMAFSTRLRVASGTARIEMHTSDGVNGYGIYVDITSTQIRIGDSVAGTWTTYTNHGASAADYLDVDVILVALSARVYWRTADLYPRTVTSSAVKSGLSSGAFATGRIYVGAEASSDVYLLRLWASYKDEANRYTVPAVTYAWELLGIPLSNAEPRYLADGMDGQVIGGIVRAEQQVASPAVHAFTITSSSAYEHMFPEVVASPRYGWTMSSTRDQTIRLRPTPSGTAARRMPSEIFGIYLGGLSAVPSFTLTGFAYDASIDVDLRLPYRYTGTGTGYSVVGDTSGTGNDLDGPWVGQDELVGCLFECEDGLRTIIGNSPGHLCSGDGSEAGLRATIHLDGTPGVDALGYIWPKQAMVIVYDTNSRVWPGEITLVIDSALADLGDGTRTIGTLAAGPIVPLGMAFDRTRADEYVVGDVLTTLPDGTAFVSSQDPGRRRMEVAYVATVHDATAQAPGGAVESMPDWIEVPSPGGTQAGADRDPVMPMWSLLAAHGRQPLVLVHMSRSDTSGSVDVQTPSPYRYGTLYCRQMGAPRWEQVPTGPGSLSAESWRMVRMNVMSFEEIP